MNKTQFKNHNSNPISPKSILSFAAALIIAFLLLTSVISLAQKYFSIRHTIRGLKNTQITLSQKEANINNENAFLNTPTGQEEELRDSYNLVRPGEGMIIITPSSTSDIVDDNSQKSAIGRLWQSILGGLGIQK